jgi:hypothetical protein
MADPFAPGPYLAEAEPLLAAALRRSGGVVVAPRPCQVEYRPRRSITIAYDARVGWHGAGPQPDRVVVRAARHPLPGQAPAAEDEHGHPVHVFPASRDPGLPGLRRALDRERIGALLADLGLAERGEAVRLHLRSYRPLRRAVVEAVGRRSRLFVKVVPPDRAEDLHRRHRLVEEVLPVPRSAGFTDDGIVVLAALPGRTLREVLLGRGELPDIRTVAATLDRLPAQLAELGRAPSPGERVADHTALIAAVLPTARARLHRVAGEIAELTAGEGAPVVPVHGDLYEAQLLVRQARIVGVLDIDGTGAGHRHDDFANMVGHLSVLAKARRSRRCERVGTEWMATIDRTGWFDPARFRAEVAAVVLGLATGSFRVQDKEWQQRTLDRLDLVDAWLDSARRAAGVVAAGIRAG